MNDLDGIAPGRQACTGGNHHHGGGHQHHHQQRHPGAGLQAAGQGRQAVDPHAVRLGERAWRHRGQIGRQSFGAGTNRQLHRDDSRQRQGGVPGGGAEPGAQQGRKFVRPQQPRARHIRAGAQGAQHGIEPGFLRAIGTARQRRVGVGNLHGHRGNRPLLPASGQGGGGDGASQGEGGQERHGAHQQRQHAIAQRPAQAEIVEPATAAAGRRAIARSRRDRRAAFRHR